MWRVYETFDANAAEGWSDGQRAIRLTVQRTKNGDALELTDKVRAYIRRNPAGLAADIEGYVFDVNADKIRQRINVLLVVLGGMGLSYVFCSCF